METVHQEQKQFLWILLAVSCKLVIDLPNGDFKVFWTDIPVLSCPQCFHDYAKFFRHFTFMPQQIWPWQIKLQKSNKVKVQWDLDVNIKLLTNYDPTLKYYSQVYYQIPIYSYFDYTPPTGFVLAASPALPLLPHQQVPVYGLEVLASGTAPFLSVLYLSEEAFLYIFLKSKGIFPFPNLTSLEGVG